MSDWIESHIDLPRHPKFRRLTRRLGTSTAETLGYLHLLWYYATEFAPGGVFVAQTPQDIADGCYWDGEPGEFVQALVETGWLDETEDGYTVHDWEEYNRLYRERAKACERMRRRRQQPEQSENIPSIETPKPVNIANVREHSRTFENVPPDKTRQDIYTKSTNVDLAQRPRLDKEGEATARDLVGYYVDQCRDSGLVVTSTDKGRLGRYVKEVITQGTPEYVIRAAIERLVEKRLGPHLLGQICNEVQARARPSPEEHERLVQEMLAKARGA